MTPVWIVWLDNTQRRLGLPIKLPVCYVPLENIQWALQRLLVWIVWLANTPGCRELPPLTPV